MQIRKQTKHNSIVMSKIMLIQFEWSHYQIDYIQNLFFIFLTFTLCLFFSKFLSLSPNRRPSCLRRTCSLRQHPFSPPPATHSLSLSLPLSLSPSSDHPLLRPALLIYSPPSPLSAFLMCSFTSLGTFRLYFLNAF